MPGWRPFHLTREVVIFARCARSTSVFFSLHDLYTEASYIQCDTFIVRVRSHPFPTQRTTQSCQRGRWGLGPGPKNHR